MPKSFAETYDLFRSLGQEGSVPSTWSLPEFSRFANDVTGSQDYDEGDTGMVGGLVKKASYWADQALQKTGLLEMSGQAGRAAFNFFGGDPEYGQKIGESIPRSFVDFAPLMVGGPAYAGAKLLGAGALSGAHTYAEGGGPLQVGASVASPFLMEAGGSAMSALARKTGLTSTVEKTLGKTVTQAGNEGTREVVGDVMQGLGNKTVDFIAHNLGAVGAAEATNYAVDAISQHKWNPYEGQSWYDRALGIAGGTLPFMVPGIKGVLGKGDKLVGKERLKPLPAETETPVVVDPFHVELRGIEADTARRLNEVQAMPEGPERDAKAQEIIDLSHQAQRQLAVKHGKSPEDILTTSVFGPTPEVKAIQDLSETARDNPAISDLMLSAWKQVPSAHVDDVKTPADLIQAHHDTQAINEVAETSVAPNSRDVVVSHLDNAGTPPDEAIKAAIVGEKNVAKKRAVDNIAMNAGKKLAQAKQRVQDIQDVKEARTNPEPIVKQSLVELDTAIKNASSSEGVVSSWNKWRKELANPSLRDSAWTSRAPIEVLKGKLGAQVSKSKKQVAQSFMPRTDDVDHKVAKTEIDEMVSNLATNSDMPPEAIAELQTNLAKGGDALTKVREALLKQRQRRLTKEGDAPLEGGQPRDTRPPSEGFDVDEFQAAQGRGEVLPTQVTPIEGEPVVIQPVTAEVEAPTGRDVFDSQLLKTGFGEQEITPLGNWLTSIKDLFGIDKLRIGELINDVSGTPVAGLANMGKIREVFLSRAYTEPGQTTAFELGATLSHELGHIIDGMAQRGEVPVRFAESFNQYKEFLANDPVGAKEFLEMMRSQLHEDVRDLPIWDQWLTSTDPKEQFANSMAMWSMSKIQGDEGRALGLLAPPQARSWLRSLTEYARRVWGAIRGTLWAKPSMGSDYFKGGIEHVKQIFDDITKSLREGEMNVNDLSTMATLGSQDVYVLRTSQLEKLSDSRVKYNGEEGQLASARDEKKGEGMLEGVWNKFLRMTNFIGDQIPAFRKSTNLLLGHGPAQSSMQNEYMAPLVGGVNADTGAIDARGPSYKSYRSLQRDVNLPANRTYSEIAQWLQQPGNGQKAFTQGQDGEWSVNLHQALKNENPTWPPGGTSTRKLGDEFNKLKPEERQAIVNQFAKSIESNRVTYKSTVDSMLEHRRGQLKIFLATRQASDHSKLDKVSQSFTDGMRDSLSEDPVTRMKGNTNLEIARQGVKDPETWKQMLDMWSQAQSDAQQMWGSYNPWHQSMIRRGKFVVRALDTSGNHYSDVVNDLGPEYKQWQENMRGAGFTKFQEPVESKQVQFKISPSDDILAGMQAIEERAKEKFNLIADPSLPEDIKQMAMEGMSVSGEMARYMNAGDISTDRGTKGLIPGATRKVTPGSMDMIETQRMAMGVIARINATKRMSSHLAFELMNPELARFPGEVAQIKQALRNYMTPDSPLGKAITKFNASFYLGGNIPSHLLNLAQSWHTTLSEAVNQGLNPISALVEVTRAAKDVAKFTLDLIKGNFGLDKDHLAVSKIKNPEERALFQKMIKDGVWNFGVLGELHDGNAEAATDINRIARTGQNKKWYDAIRSPIAGLSNFTMKAFAATEHFNQRVATLVGHRIARKQMGASYDQSKSFDFARDFMRSSTYAGGRANRPVMQGNLKTVGNMAYSLQTYSIGWLNQLTRYVSHWKGSEYLDLSPTQRTNARRAALTLLGVQFASAGALGMPFVGAALKIAEKVSGQAITGNAYAKLSELLDEDKQDGQGLSNIIMNGAANAALANSGVPIDLGSRWAMSGVFGLNPYDGFSGDSVFGPTGQTVAAVVSGIKSTLGGDLAQAGNQLAPPALKKAIALWRNGGEIRTSSGSPVESGDWMKAAYGMGFTPQSLSNLNQYGSYKKQVEESLEIEHKREAANILSTLQTDPIAARNLLVQQAQRAGEEPQQAAKRVALTAADQAFPLDVRRGTGSQTGQQLMGIAKAVGVPPVRASEMARSSYMNSVLQMLGMPPIMMRPEAAQRDTVGEELTPFSVFHQHR